MPHLFRRFDASKLFPLPWAIFHWLPGNAVDPAAVGQSQISTERLADFLLTLRRRPHEEGSASTRDRPPSHDTPLIREAFDLLQAQGWYRRELESLWQACIDCPVYCGRPAWVHDDLIPPNLLQQKGEITAVIDFGSYALGDPAVDLIPAWTRFRGAASSTFLQCISAVHFCSAFLQCMAAEPAAIERARAYALRQALQIIPYYPKSNPPLVRMAEDMLREILREWRG